MRFFILVVVFFSTQIIDNQLLIAQNDTLPIQTFKDGLLQVDLTNIAISEEEMIEALMPVIPGVGSSSRNLLEEKSVKAYMMPPREKSKKGHLYAYTLAAILEYYANFKNNFKDNLSPDYISLSTPVKNLEEGLKFLAVNGTVSAAIMPYDATAISPAIYATQKYKIRQYLRVFTAEHNSNRRIFETRKALMRGNPVLVTMKVDEAFLKNKGTKFWHKTMKETTDEVTLIVVGYSHELESFELMGNWGADWADNGYLFMDYEDFGKNATAGFVIVPDRDFK